MFKTTSANVTNRPGHPIKVVEMRSPSLLVLGLATAALAHGDHGGGGSGSEQVPMGGEHANWMARHMAGKVSHESRDHPPLRVGSRQSGKQPHG